MTASNAPTPASMPRRIASCTPGRSARRNTAKWVVVETLDNEGTPSVILDGHLKRRFANLGRVSIATSPTHVRLLDPLVRRCAASGHTELDLVRLPTRSDQRIIATPILGPGNQVYGVSLCTRSSSDGPSHPPTIGAIEWDIETVLATVSPGLRTLLHIPDDELRSPATFPDLIRRFDSWSDRNGILALFDIEESADTWIGTATTQSTQGPRRNLRITARKVPARNTVRALVCDITNIDPVPAADPVSAALRRVPIAPGHALAIIDLRDRLIHEWIAEEPLAGWRNRHPEIHPDDSQYVADICTRLLTGTSTATITARIRFGPTEDWIPLQATWTRITNDNRPQALIDVVLVGH